MPRLTRRTALRLALAGTAGLPLLALPARAATHQVTIAGFAFNPDTLAVAPGDTVVFTNSDGAPHTATAEDGSFDTGTIRGGQSASVTVPAGSHAYRCKFHSSMRGTITA